MSATFRVSLPDGAHFEAAADDDLLAAAQRAHWLVRYGCRNGNCEACAALLLQGSVRHRDGTLIDAATAAGTPAPRILLCLCRPLTDLRIALPGDPRSGSVEQSRRVYAQLHKQDVADDASILCFLLPAGRQPAVLPGQIALIETDTGLLQASIDSATARARELVLQLTFASPLRAGAYYHVRYPLNATPP